MTKPVFAICEQTGADQPMHPCSLISAFAVRSLDSTCIMSLHVLAKFIQNLKTLATCISLNKI